jgi:hypothetical protein
MATVPLVAVSFDFRQQEYTNQRWLRLRRVSASARTDKSDNPAPRTPQPNWTDRFVNAPSIQKPVAS